jgi:hypothetical protein
MVDTKLFRLGAVFSPTGNGGGFGAENPEIPALLAKVGTFARAVATEQYKIDQGFAFDSGLIFPLLGINHLITRGIFQPLERMALNVAEPEQGGAAKMTAEVALKDPSKFFENGENHFSPQALQRLQDCIAISSKICDAEREGHDYRAVVKKTDLTTAELALRDLTAAFDKLAADNPDNEGVARLAADYKTLSAHFSGFTQKLLPQLDVSAKPGQKR